MPDSAADGAAPTLVTTPPSLPPRSTAVAPPAPTQVTFAAPAPAYALPHPPRRLRLLGQQVAPRWHRQQEVAARPRQTVRHDTFHLLLGGLLIAAGIVAGLLLGGWLGLGVGALIVILGYYFVVLGIGGQHAWLEIFQEFFNM